jgi:hypothetical protein
MGYDKTKHLEFIQNIISRLNSNSFQIKTWAITLIIGLFAVYATNHKTVFIIISAFPIIIFWFIDSYYLYQERKYRKLYNEIIKQNNSIPEYSLDTTSFKFGIIDYFKSLFSPSKFLVYLTILSIVILIYIKLEYLLLTHIFTCNSVK